MALRAYPGTNRHPSSTRSTSRPTRGGSAAVVGGPRGRAENLPGRQWRPARTEEGRVRPAPASRTGAGQGEDELPQFAARIIIVSRLDRVFTSGPRGG